MREDFDFPAPPPLVAVGDQGSAGCQAGRRNGSHTEPRAALRVRFRRPPGVVCFVLSLFDFGGAERELGILRVTLACADSAP